MIRPSRKTIGMKFHSLWLTAVFAFALGCAKQPPPQIIYVQAPDADAQFADLDRAVGDYESAATILDQRLNDLESAKRESDRHFNDAGFSASVDHVLDLGKKLQIAYNQAYSAYQKLQAIPELMERYRIASYISNRDNLGSFVLASGAPTYSFSDFPHYQKR